jgi:hypothetical protein
MDLINIDEEPLELNTGHRDLFSPFHCVEMQGGYGYVYVTSIDPIVVLSGKHTSKVPIYTRVLDYEALKPS